MRVKLIKPRRSPPTKTSHGDTLPVGTTIEAPDAYWLVGFGTAVPDDDECVAKVAEMAEEHPAFRPRETAGPKIVRPGQAAAVQPPSVDAAPESPTPLATS